jgi:hypothetical protein
MVRPSETSRTRTSGADFGADAPGLAEVLWTPFELFVFGGYSTLQGSTHRACGS